MTQKKFAASILDDLKSSADRLTAESRSRKPQQPLSFGIKYLDDALKGIGKNDFVVLGARSGIGKTEAAKLCALANARTKRVHFFALEAEENEIETRIKYSILSEVVHKTLHGHFVGRNFNYTDWHYGEFEEILGRYETEINSIITDSFPGLHTYYQKTTSLNETNIEQTVLALQSQTDLIIIDHLHYFDFEDENENRAMKGLVKKLKMLSSTCDVPILMLAHLRKTDRRFRTAVPDLDDFHGSSDITKIATKVIMLSAAPNESTDIYRFPTYITAVKNRLDNSRTRYTGLCAFDVRRNDYDQSYFLGSFSADGQEFVHTKDGRRPYWAKHALPCPPDEGIPSLETKPVRPIRRPGTYKNN